MSLGYALPSLGSKYQCHNALITINGLCCIIAFHLHRNALIPENGLCPVIAFPLHLNIKLHIKMPVELMCHVDFRVKQSRSQCNDYWKKFLEHNCFPFTSAIIKHRTQIPSESRICSNDNRVKYQRVFVRHSMPPVAKKSKKLFLASRSQGHWPWCHLKGHHYWSMHAKYEVSISYGSKVVAKVKVDNRQTGQKQYAPNHSIPGALKQLTNTLKIRILSQTSSLYS